MQWIEFTVNTAPERLEAVTEHLENAGIEGLIVEDEGEYTEFLEENRAYWDYVDEDFAASIRGVCRVKFYVEASENGELLARSALAGLAEEEILRKDVQDEDWENNWKAYYKPISVGDRLLIVPQWEEAHEPGRVELRLDPGLIFGTGSHATTRMCLEALQELELDGKDVLDLGCGSGILAIAALLLGAERALGCDIDPKAPDVVRSNAALNGVERKLEALAGDCLKDGDLRAGIAKTKYPVILANIVADVILALAPSAAKWITPDGVFVTSGIIDGREAEVRSGLEAAGFRVKAHRRQDNWHCFICVPA